MGDRPRAVSLTLDGIEYVVVDLLSTASPADAAATRLPPAGLSRVERALVEGLLRGRRNADLARERGTSRHTIANQLSILYRRLGVGSRAEVVALVSGRGAAGDLATWALVSTFVGARSRTVVLHRPAPPRDRLTARECEVATRVASGQSNKAVAIDLGIAGATVAVHLTRAARKLGVASRAELILLVSALAERRADFS
jgi:DNA-binding CsgD family transcriptional regulator